MKTAINYSTLLLLCAALFFAGCKKDEDDPIIPDDPTPTESSVPVTPQIAGADAALWAVNSVTVTSVAGFEVETNIGIAVGAFAADGDFNDLVDAGTVSVDGNNLTRHGNNSYTLTPSQTNPMGIEYQNEVNWEVSGGAGFSAFTYSSTIAWPTASEITSGTTVSKSSGYVVSVNTVNNADSVLFMVGGVIKTIPGNATSCAFSADDLSGLSNGTNVVTVAPYASEPQNFDGKIVYIGKEAVRSQTVTIED